MNRIGFKAKGCGGSQVEERPVEHLDYYKTKSGIECISVAQEFNFNLGNVIKYIWRAGKKFECGLSDREKAVEDLKKAKVYIDYEISRICSDGRE